MPSMPLLHYTFLMFQSMMPLQACRVTAACLLPWPLADHSVLDISVITIEFGSVSRAV